MDDRSRAEQLFFEGNRLLSARDPAAAEACFREALRRVPDFPEALANLAWTLEQRGALAEAEACYLRSLALEPECLEVYLDLGVLLVNQKRFEEAERVYGCALQLAPESAAAWSNLGVLNACRKQEAEAEACYRKALALDETYRQGPVQPGLPAAPPGALRGGVAFPGGPGVVRPPSPGTSRAPGGTARTWRARPS